MTTAKRRCSASDTRHRWFRSKGTFVAAAIQRHVPADRRDGYLVDVGAGAGGVTVLGWPPRRLLAVDGSESLVASAHKRHSVLAAVGAGERLPLREGQSRS